MRKSQAFNLSVLTAMTIWSAVAFPWLLPALVAFTASTAVIPYLVWRKLDGERAAGLFLTKFVLAAFAFAYFIGLLGGRPYTARFWEVFGVVFALFAPTWVGLRSLIRSSQMKGQS